MGPWLRFSHSADRPSILKDDRPFPDRDSLCADRVVWRHRRGRTSRHREAPDPLGIARSSGCLSRYRAIPMRTRSAPSTTATGRRAWCTAAAVSSPIIIRQRCRCGDAGASSPDARGASRQQIRRDRRDRPRLVASAGGSEQVPVDWRAFCQILPEKILRIPRGDTQSQSACWIWKGFWRSASLTGFCRRFVTALVGAKASGGGLMLIRRR